MHRIKKKFELHDSYRPRELDNSNLKPIKFYAT